ncbi:MAG: ABC transporter permease [Oscillospiraceae bacterium]|jgi:putative ABC transport system permease protein|nr:ABC transporter permease [Oscillospiraceae bacterium]
MWLKKLRHRKPQFILAGVILFVSALIFSASLSFMVESNRFGEAYYSREGLPNLLICSNDGRTDGTIREIFSGSVLRTLEGFQLTQAVEINGKKINGLFMVYPLEDFVAEIPWDFEPKVGDINAKGPKPGEIWVPRVWADMKDIEAGDTLVIQGGVSLRVSALCNSYINPSSTMSLYQFFIHPDEIRRLPELPDEYVVPLYVEKDYDQVKSAILAAVKGHYGVVAVDQGGLIMSLSMIAILMGGIGLLSAILVFAVAVIAIRFMLRANLMKEYRAIGIYKSQGFPNRRIRGFYLSGYTAVGGVSMLLGVIAGFPATAALCQMGMRYVGNFEFSGLIFALSALSFVLLMAALLLNVFLATKPIRKITPVDALRIGVTSTRAKFKRAWIRNASSPLSMAVNDIGKHKGHSATIVLILCVSFYLTFFALSTLVTTKAIAEDLDIWFGVPKADVFVTGRVNDGLIGYLESNPAVEKLIVSEEIFKTPITLDEMYGCSDQVNALFFSDFSTLPYTMGRGPQAVNEIALSTTLLRNLDMRPGEYLSLTIGEEEDTYLITGSYDSMMNGGTTVQLLSDCLPVYDDEFNQGILMILLKKDAAPADLIEELNRTYEGVLAEANLEMVADAATGVSEMVVPMTLVMIVMFSVFSVLNISNLLLQDHADSRRQYGILKAMGFSAAYITARSAWKIFLLAIVASVLSFLLHILCSRALFAAAVINALRPALPQTLLMLGGLLALLMAVTFLFCLPIRKITPLELMEE